eukprot:7451730-Ditylum_brightwellii.AAC.1
MKVAARQWHSLREEVKAAWKKRAAKLNMLPVPGGFRSFLNEFLKKPEIQSNSILEELVFDSLKLDWEMVCKVVRSSIAYHPQVSDSQRMFVVGRDMVIIQSQVFRSFHMNKLLKADMFGCGFEKVKENEIVFKKRGCHSSCIEAENDRAVLCEWIGGILTDKEWDDFYLLWYG